MSTDSMSDGEFSSSAISDDGGLENCAGFGFGVGVGVSCSSSEMESIAEVT